MTPPARSVVLPALFAATLVLAANASPARAEPAASRWFAAECAQRLPATSVRVDTAPQAYTVRADLGIKALSGMRSDGARGEGHTALGMTVAKVQSSLTIGSRLLRDPTTGQKCIRPQIQATLTNSPMQVYVAREFADNACVYEHILGHEMRHVRAYQEQLEHASRKLEASMRGHFGNEVFYGDESALRAQLEDDMRTRWLPLAMSYLQEVRSLHAMIDTPEEYARNRTVCGGQVARVLGSQPAARH